MKASNVPLTPKFYIIDTMLDRFPHKVVDGVCEQLVKDGDYYGCGVYDDRPAICNVDGMHVLYKHEHPSLREYYEMTEKACRLLMHAVFDLDDHEINLKYDLFKQTFSQPPREP